MEYSRTETIIYGGAFNPPTLAHQAILQACIDYAEPRSADIWLLPSGSRKDKSIDALPEYRLELCEALLKDVMKRTVEVSIFTLELDREAPTETYETVQALNSAHPDRNFTWVFGSDSVASMPSWNHGEWLKDNLQMLVVDRSGSPEIQLGTNALWLVVNTPLISSTEVRRRLAVGEEYDELVSSNVKTLLQRT